MVSSLYSFQIAFTGQDKVHLLAILSETVSE